MSEIVAGLDIGTTKIVAIIGRKNENGKLEILGMSRTQSLGVARGVVTHLQQTRDAIRKVMEEAMEESQYEVKQLNVGIAGQHIRSAQHNGSIHREDGEKVISQEDINLLIRQMHNLVMLPGEQVIDVLPQEFTVDNERGISEPIGMAGKHLGANFHIITGNVAAARNIDRCVTDAGFEVENLILEPLASAESVLSEEEKEAGVALVDIGGGTTDLAIFKDGKIRHTAVIPLGGNIITEDIREGCAIIKSQAEKLKTRFGSAVSTMASSNEIISIPGIRGRAPKEISRSNLASIIEARMQEIIEQVFYEIQNSGLEDKLNVGIVVTGGGSQLKNITQLFEYITGMDTRVGYPTEHLAEGDAETTTPMYSTGIGLILKGFERIEQTAHGSESISELENENELENEKGSALDNLKTWLGKYTDKWINDLTD